MRASLLEYLHACPICRGAALVRYCRVPSLFNPGEFIAYERCTVCGTVLRNPRLAPEYRLDRYEERESTAAEKRLDPRSQVHYWYMMDRVRRLASRGGRRLLDFGCGAGGFLLEARAAGFDVMGLELNRDLARQVTSTYGIPVYQGLIEAPEFAAERFDVILSSQVFEHLLDPRGTLMALRGHLNEAGLLLIEVPNLRDIRERLRRGSTMDDSHIFYFSRRSLAGLLSDCGFRTLRIEEGLRPFRFLGESARRWPPAALSLVERILSGLQIKTVLSVIARRV